MPLLHLLGVTPKLTSPPLLLVAGEPTPPTEPLQLTNKDVDANEERQVVDEV